MIYEEAKNYIDSIGKLGSRPGIDAIKILLKRLGNPQDKLNVIHVAGTNGKGSICTYIEYGLRECGFNVGRYISPTLFSYLERFQINGELMSEDEYAEIVSEVKACCDDMVADGHMQPTAFEIETAVSFMYFLRNNVDVVILETGMGGKEDATNVVKKPIATVFASISFDHMAFLGDTIEKIAMTKSGIMRDGVPVIVSHMPLIYDEKISRTSNAYYTLKAEANRIGAKFYEADDLCKAVKDIASDADGNLYYKYARINNPLKGEFQKINMQAALMTLSVLMDRLKSIIYEKNDTVDANNAVSIQNFVKGIEKTKWPGRFEVISDNPLIIRDGAHNEDAVRLLKNTIVSDKSIPDKMHLIMGVFKDKDYRKMLREISTVAKSFTAITPPNKQRALEAKELCEVAKETLGDSIKYSYKDSLKEAINSIDVGDGEGILVFGSLSLAGLFEAE